VIQHLPPWLAAHGFSLTWDDRLLAWPSHVADRIGNCVGASRTQGAEVDPHRCAFLSDQWVTVREADGLGRPVRRVDRELAAS
jgi:hypothetical protein